MNNLLKITALLWFAMGFGQDYTPLVDHRNEWQLINCYMGDCLTDIFYTDGDTIVNGKSYKILDGYHYISRSFWLRENPVEKKVYLKTIFDEPDFETLLYDFNLEAGDSIHLFNPISPFPADGGYFVVDSIKIQPITPTQNGKFFYFSPGFDNEANFGNFPIWVEGVGSLALINAPGGNPDYDGAGQISCFWKNQDLFYWDTERVDACESIMAANSPTVSSIQFVVRPGKIARIENAENIQTIWVYDRNGRLIQQLKGNGQVRLEFDLNAYPKGVYFLKIKEKNQFFYHSFLMK